MDVSGSGKDGRVLKEDVVRHMAGGQAPTSVCPAAAVKSAPRLAPLTADRIVPLKGYSRAMLKTMTEANQIPHFGYNDEIVVDRLVDLREQLKRMAKERGVRMSYMPMFIKVVSRCR